MNNKILYATLAISVILAITFISLYFLKEDCDSSSSGTGARTGDDCPDCNSCCQDADCPDCDSCCPDCPPPTEQECINNYPLTNEMPICQLHPDGEKPENEGGAYWWIQTSGDISDRGRKNADTQCLGWGDVNCTWRRTLEECEADIARYTKQIKPVINDPSTA